MSTEFYPRDFEGIWIPKEIYCNENLNAIEKLIFTEINSLDRHLSGGDYCYASNEYLAKFCGCSLTKVSTSISMLIKSGYLEVVKTDGHKRWIKSLLKERLSNSERQTFENNNSHSQELKESNISSNNNYQYTNKNNKESFSFQEETLDIPFEEEETGWRWKSDKAYIDYVEKVLPNMIADMSKKYGRDSAAAYNVFLTIFKYFLSQYRVFSGTRHPWYKEDTLIECFNEMLNSSEP